MKANLTPMQKMIMQEIKKHNKERDYLNDVNKGIQFEYMKRDREVVTGDISILIVKVKCSFKPSKKWMADKVWYKVYISSDGHISLIYDGSQED